MIDLQRIVLGEITMITEIATLRRQIEEKNETYLLEQDALVQEIDALIEPGRKVVNWIRWYASRIKPLVSELRETSNVKILEIYHAPHYGSRKSGVSRHPTFHHWSLVVGESLSICASGTRYFKEVPYHGIVNLSDPSSSSPSPYTIYLGKHVEEKGGMEVFKQRVLDRTKINVKSILEDRSKSILEGLSVCSKPSGWEI